MIELQNMHKINPALASVLPRKRLMRENRFVGQESIKANVDDKPDQYLSLLDVCFQVCKVRYSRDFV